MAWQRMVLEIGMGTDIRGGDSTKAAVRALRDALWHNSLGIAGLLGQPSDAMRVAVTIGVPRPETVAADAVLAVLPHGTGTVTVVEGGLAIPRDDGGDVTLIAHAAAVVYMDVPDSMIGAGAGASHGR
ncbi:MAG: Lin0512 family protein [Alphaproteobacteria bacterium]|nr:Lin0512 family protein [Alphaproteobacteria bacterium]